MGVSGVTIPLSDEVKNEEIFKFEADIRSLRDGRKPSYEDLLAALADCGLAVTPRTMRPDVRDINGVKTSCFAQDIEVEGPGPHSQTTIWVYEIRSPQDPIEIRFHKGDLDLYPIVLRHLTRRTGPMLLYLSGGGGECYIIDGDVCIKGKGPCP